MPPLNPLTVDALYRHCDLSGMDFSTTDQLEDIHEVLGQSRAIEAIEFGIGIRQQGYNLYALGPPGMGKHSAVRHVVDGKAAVEPPPADWCYVNNFSEPRKPKAISLPQGRGTKLRDHMQQLVEDLRSLIPSTLESQEFRRRLQAIDDEFSAREEEAFKELGDISEKESITLLRTPQGFVFAPVKDTKTLSPEDFDKLSDEEKDHIEKTVAALQEKLQDLLYKIPLWHREKHAAARKLRQETVSRVVSHVIDEIKANYQDIPSALTYLDAVEEDVAKNIDLFQDGQKPMELGGMLVNIEAPMQRYSVNVLADHDGSKGAPVVYEDNPMFQRLVGQVDHVQQLGTLITNFTLIKAGALHKANGGYLLLDAHKLLTQPYAWEGLKRALRSREIRIESLGQIFSIISTVALEPEPIPLDVKVILFGERYIYYLLYELDPDFGELFKVAADFEEDMDRKPENDTLYARLIGTIARKEKLLPLNRDAVARVIEQSSRRVGDSEKLSTHLQGIADLLREADHLARKTNSGLISDNEIQATIDAQIRRSDRLRKRHQEAILRGTKLIDTEGAQSGQINGLAVMELGGFAFAQPTRITATTRLGEGEVIDIEREVELGGAIHSKGVLILSSFLAARYSRNLPLSLSASLVFEQSYREVEGDSASMAELCALLSALANAPISQSMAITGSVNQYGQAQPIGGVNEKIEGFFDICKARGLTGNQGVIIPDANVKHLMLRKEVVDAVSAGQFRIHSVENVDEAMELLTGIPAGEPDEQGLVPEGTINYMVATRLAEFSAMRQAYALAGKKQGDKKRD